MKLSKKGEHRKRLFVSSAPSRPPAGVYRFGAEMPLALPERGTGNRSPRSSASGSVLGLLASIALSPGQLACSVSTHTTTVPFSIRGRALNEGLTKGALGKLSTTIPAGQVRKGLPKPNQPG